MSKAKVVIEQNPESPVEKKVLAQAIVDISNAMKKLHASGLNKRAIALLTSNSAKKPLYVVEDVMRALEDLQRDYCK